MTWNKAYLGMKDGHCITRDNWPVGAYWYIWHDPDGVAEDQIVSVAPNGRTETVAVDIEELDATNWIIMPKGDK